jgi:hypothetical protein
LVGAEGDEVQTPSGGLWLGSRITAQKDGRPVKLVNVRTYVS